MLFSRFWIVFFVHGCLASCQHPGLPRILELTPDVLVRVTDYAALIQECCTWLTVSFAGSAMKICVSVIFLVRLCIHSLLVMTWSCAPLYNSLLKLIIIINLQDVVHSCEVKKYARMCKMAVVTDNCFAVCSLQLETVSEHLTVCAPSSWKQCQNI